MSEIDDFVRRHPHGSDLQSPVPEPPKPKMQSFIPSLYAEALAKRALINQAKARGYSPADIRKLEILLFGPREPVLVSLDEIYGEEQ